jgi:CheY-like chemotaxis protein
MARPNQILVAGIDHDFLARLQVLFGDKGYETTAALDGPETVMLLQSKQFDLVLLSDYLPDASVEQVWRALRRLPSCPSVAILQTSQQAKEIVNQYQRFGGRCILSRESPFKVVESVYRCLSSGESSRLNWKGASVSGGKKAQAEAGSSQSGSRSKPDGRSVNKT